MLHQTSSCCRFLNISTHNYYQCHSPISDTILTSRTHLFLVEIMHVEDVLHGMFHIREQVRSEGLLAAHCQEMVLVHQLFQLLTDNGKSLA